jgi:hypothetical protein
MGLPGQALAGKMREARQIWLQNGLPNNLRLFHSIELSHPLNEKLFIF